MGMNFAVGSNDIRYASRILCQCKAATYTGRSITDACDSRRMNRGVTDCNSPTRDSASYTTYTRRNIVRTATYTTIGKNRYVTDVDISATHAIRAVHRPSYTRIAIAARYSQFIIPAAACDCYSTAIFYINTCAAVAGNVIVLTHNVDGWRCIIGYVNSRTTAYRNRCPVQINGRFASRDIERSGTVAAAHYIFAIISNIARGICDDCRIIGHNGVHGDGYRRYFSGYDGYPILCQCHLYGRTACFCHPESVACLKIAGQSENPVVFLLPFPILRAQFG